MDLNTARVSYIAHITERAFRDEGQEGRGGGDYE